METCKALFSDKTPISNNIVLSEEEEIVTDNSACAEILNIFFSRSVENLEIDRDLCVNNAAKLDDPIDNVIQTFKDHPSIVSISQKGFTPNSFSFKNVSEENVYEVINNLDSSKAYQIINIPPKFLKENADICTIVLCKDINRKHR